MLSMLLAWLMILLATVVPNVDSQCINETEVVYVRGTPSISQTLVKCLSNIPDPVLYPGYSLPDIEPLTVSMQFAINNLIKVDEIQNLVSFDFFFRTFWTDPRLSMPPLWSVLNKNDSSLGVEINPLLNGYQTVNGYQFGIWVPDFIFIDALSTEQQARSLKIYPNGSVAQSQHLVITLMQSNFEYLFYPDDEQTLNMRVASYILNPNQLRVQAYNGLPIVLYSSVSDQPSFTLNPLWGFVESYFNVVIENNGTPGRPRLRSTAIVSLVVRRYSHGVVFRLGLPMFLLVLLAGIAFWANPVDRMNVSITILLAVAALYIVVFQNIPMIGILTSFDKYVIVSFLMLFFCCILHQVVIRFGGEKTDKWPLRGFYTRMFEAIGRVFVIPIILIIFLVYFPYAFMSDTVITIAVFMSLWSAFLIAREGRSVIVKFRLAMGNIKSKIENLSNLSTYELLIFNRYTYGKYSFSLTPHLKEKQEMERELERRVAARNSGKEDSDDEDMGSNSVEMTTVNPMKAAVSI